MNITMTFSFNDVAQDRDIPGIGALLADHMNNYWRYHAITFASSAVIPDPVVPPAPTPEPGPA